MTGYFVTGTDTGVGKTTVAACLLAAARERGLRVGALKPAETGCAPGPDGTLIPEDGVRLRAACGPDAPPLDIVCPQRYRLPVAPSVAARREGRPFALARTRAALAAQADRFVVVEGAGGLLVPYADDYLCADLAADLGLPLLIVARAALGTINHTLLTISEARRRALPIAAIILNRVTPTPTPDDESNASEITRHSHLPVLGPLPHNPTEAGTVLGPLLSE